MDGLKMIVEKLSQYNFLTNILPGTVLCIVLTYWVGYNLLLTDEWYVQGIIFYFVGIVNNRFGSLVIEPIFKKCKFAKFAKHDDYIKAEEKDNKIKTLNTDNNLFRSCIALCSLSIIAQILFLLDENYNWLNCWPKGWKSLCILIILLVLFGFSYRKQTGYVKSRVNKVNTSTYEM